MNGSVRGRFTGFEAFEGIVDVAVVDGVTVVRSAAAGPIAAGLMFRVGIADEPLAHRGITHLVEHLALHRHDVLAEHKNGHVLSVTTHFVVSGSEAQVVDFLNGVCAGLRDLPLDRLGAEKSILRAEAQARAGVAEEPLLRARFGAQGHAMPVYREFGLESVDADALAAWARRWFVAENAVLWLTGTETPRGLDLRLPSGRWQPFPAVEEVSRPGPTWTSGPAGAVAADVLVPRATVGTVFAEVASKALFRELRLEGALSYTAGAQYEPVDPERARILFFADATPEHEGAVAGAMVDLLAGFRAGRFHERDLVSAKKAIREGVDAVREGAGAASAVAGAYLLGDRLRHPDEIVSDVDDVTVDQLRDFAERIWPDITWQTPIGPLDWIGAEEVTYWSTDTVEGATFDFIGTPEHLVVGEEGVSVVTPDGVATVRRDDCRLTGVQADGARLLIGANGIMLAIEPTVVRGVDATVIDQIDAVMPSETIVRLPAREPESIPQPPQRAEPVRLKGFGAWAIMLAFPLALFGLAVLVGAIQNTAEYVLGAAPGTRVSPAMVATSWILAILMIGAVAGLIAGWVRRLRSSGGDM